MSLTDYRAQLIRTASKLPAKGAARRELLAMVKQGGVKVPHRKTKASFGLNLTKLDPVDESTYKFQGTLGIGDLGGDGADVQVKGTLNWLGDAWAVEDMSFNQGDARDLLTEILNYDVLDRLPAP
jgi:hypothetical protein